MKKRFFVLLLAASMVVSTAGCSAISKMTGKDSSQKDTSADAKKYYKEALENLKKAETISMDYSLEDSFDNGMSETSEYTAVYDSKNKVVETYNNNEDGDTVAFQYFYLEEGDGGYGIYASDQTTDQEWEYYEDVADSEDTSEYGYQKNLFFPGLSKSAGYSDIKYVSAEEDTYDDIDCYKVKITSKLQTAELTSEDEYTREDVLEEYEITEDAVDLVDGFSDVIDAYVKAENDESNNSDAEITQTAWISKDDMQFVKVETVNDQSKIVASESNQATENFLNESYKAVLAQSYLDDGMSKKEAKKKLEKEVEAMENPESEVVDSDDLEAAEDEDVEDDSSVSDEIGSETSGIDSALLKETETLVYHWGDDAIEMDEIPENVVEKAQEDMFKDDK